MRLVWDATGDRLYHTGVDHCVLYPWDNNANDYGTGVAWNGITAINESPSGAEANPLYADNIKYLNLISAEDFGATVEAYTFPNEWYECDGSGAIAPGVYINQQNRKTFGLVYRTILGNDTLGDKYGYEIHIIYGGKAAPSERANNTVNDSPEAQTMSWEISTVPAAVSAAGMKPTAHLKIDSTLCDPAKLALLEDQLFGSASNDPTLLMPDEVAALMGTAVSAVPVNMYLVGATSDNMSKTAATNATYVATITANDGKSIENVVVVMGDEDITDTAWAAGTHKVTIANPTGPIAVFATAN